MNIKRTSISLIFKPILILLVAILSCIIFLNLANETYTINFIYLTIIIYLLSDLKKGIEIDSNNKRFRFYKRMFFKRRGVWKNLPSIINNLILSEVTRKMSVHDSKSLLYSNSRIDKKFVISFKLADCSIINVISSSNYELLYSYCNLLSDYYNIAITEENVLIEYPETGDYSSEYKNTNVNIKRMSIK